MKSLSFSAEKGYNFFGQVKQYHTVLSLINELYVFTLILLHLMWIHRSQLSHFTTLWFWQQDLDRFHMEMQLAFIRLKLTI